jgi:hypothetical protein
LESGPGFGCWATFCRLISQSCSFGSGFRIKDDEACLFSFFKVAEPFIQAELPGGSQGCQVDSPGADVHVFSLFVKVAAARKIIWEAKLFMAPQRG